MHIRRPITAACFLAVVSVACSTPTVVRDRERRSPPPVVQTHPPHTIYAQEIKAGRVTARTIYANEISAQHVHGDIHRIERLDTRGWSREIEAGTVSASVIYVKELDAQSIEADTIYVHRMKVKHGRGHKRDH